MDELVIDDKKYLSSKQAAKVTGYAKDYIGQMCREGRVPARLVGRSWYVLESALKDHRFGGEKEKAVSGTEEAEVYSRYEADELEVVEASSKEEAVEEVPEVEAPRHIHHTSIQEAWEAWFDRVAHTAETASLEVQEETREVETVEVTEEPEEAVEEEGQAVAIHTLKIAKEEVVAVKPVTPTAMPRPIVQAPPKKKFKALRAVSVVIAAFSVGIVVLNTGYFDSYIISSKQDSFISGITIYKK